MERSIRLARPSQPIRLAAPSRRGLAVVTAILGAWMMVALFPQSASAANPKTARSDVDKRILSAKDVQTYIAPYAKKIGDCYRRHAIEQKSATGDLKLELIIHRDGSVFKHKVWAEGVKGKGLVQCIGKLVKAWSFPPRRGFSHAIVPFFYLKTTSKGAGPMMSCWSAKGCPKKRRQQRRSIRSDAKKKGADPKGASEGGAPSKKKEAK